MFGEVRRTELDAGNPSPSFNYPWTWEILLFMFCSVHVLFML
jgi:hypothetical protein